MLIIDVFHFVLSSCSIRFICREIARPQNIAARYYFLPNQAAFYQMQRHHGIFSFEVEHQFSDPNDRVRDFDDKNNELLSACRICLRGS